MNKNPGPKLFFSRFGGETPIPPEFIAAMEREETSQPVPNEVGPEKLSDTVVESEVKTDRTGERVRKTVKKKKGNVGPLRFIHTDDKGRPVQASRLLYPTGSTLSTVPNAYTAVAVQDLGNGWSIEEVGVEGVYVGGVFQPGLFPAVVFQRESPSVIPSEFNADKDVVEFRLDSAGTAADPVMYQDDLRITEEQITQDKKRVTHRLQESPTIPKINNLHRDTNEAKQLVLETHTLKEELDPDSPSNLPDALTDIKVIQHGDGRKTEIKRQVTELFKARSFVAEVPDNIPPEFRTSNSTKTTEELLEGLAGPPFLSTHEIAKRETQVNEFVKRVQTTSRITTMGTSVVEHRIDGINDGRGSFFDGDVVRARSLAASSAADTETFLTLDSQVKALGGTPDFPSGVWERSTSAIDAFPTLSGSTVDEETGVRTAVVKNIVAAGTTPPSTYASMFPLNKVRTLQVVESIDDAAITAISFVFPGTTNIDFPTELTSINGSFESASAGIGVYDQIGGWQITGHGSASMTLHGSAQGNAGIMPEVTYGIRQVWGVNVPCTHVLFYVLNGSTRANILAKLAAIPAISTISDWPTFVPRSETFVSHGERVAGNAVVDLHRTSTTISDYTGAFRDGAEGGTTGYGQSYDVAITTKVLRIPPTIHVALGLTLPTTTPPTTNPAFAAFSAGARISVDGAGSTGIIPVSGTATGRISPSFLTATLGQATVPTSGVYLYRLVSEVYKKNYIKVHAEVVKFNANGVISL